MKKYSNNCYLPWPNPAATKRHARSHLTVELANFIIEECSGKKDDILAMLWLGNFAYLITKGETFPRDIIKEGLMRNCFLFLWLESFPFPKTIEKLKKLQIDRQDFDYLCNFYDAVSFIANRIYKCKEYGGRKEAIAFYEKQHAFTPKWLLSE